MAAECWARVALLSAPRCDRCGHPTGGAMFGPLVEEYWAARIRWRRRAESVCWALSGGWPRRRATRSSYQGWHAWRRAWGGPHVPRLDWIGLMVPRGGAPRFVAGANWSAKGGRRATHARLTNRGRAFFVAVKLGERCTSLPDPEV